MDDLDKLYRIRFSDANRAKKDAIWRVLCEHFFQRYVSPQDTVLDIACGYGEFTRHIRAARKIAVDLNPDAARSLPAGVEFHLTTAADLAPIATASLDVCFRSNFFQPPPPKGGLDQARAQPLGVLKPGRRHVAMRP